MFNKKHLKEILSQYKAVFIKKTWPDEKYKWIAVKCFQDNWNIDAQNFAGMLKASFAKADNLLNASMYFPAAMIVEFALAAPLEVKKMYINLFDENVDICKRVADFKNKADELLNAYGKGAKNHYQTENSIFTYLWLRYPDKYYIYKFREVKAVANELESSYTFKQGAYADNIRNFLQFYNEINIELKQDAELKMMLKKQVDSECYPDDELKTLTIDVGYYISRTLHTDLKDVDNADTQISPEMDKKENSTPNFWKISHGLDFFSKNELEELAKRRVVVVHKDTSGKGRTKISQGEDFVHNMRKGDIFYLCYGNSVILLGKITSEETSQSPNRETGWVERGYSIIAESANSAAYNGEQKWWTPNDRSTCIPIKEKDMDLFEKNILYPYFQTTLAELLGRNSDHNYWFLNANPKIWSMATMPVGKVQDYTLYNDNGNKRKVFQNFLDAKAGDMVIGYECTPVKKVVALMQIEAENDGECLYFKKLEGLNNPIEYSRLKDCPELEKMQFLAMPQGSLFKLTKEEYDCIYDMIREDNPPFPQDIYKLYTKADFLKDVYMSEEKYDRLVAVLTRKKNIILQGAPGVGKTFAAKRLAYSMMGKIKKENVEFIQFHQNYSYEDFIMGYKPKEDGFELKYGIFYKFCQRAASHPDEDFFFIIDEINRGNMSKIFGELLMLIEKDYREVPITLAYDDLKFSVPENLYIIGLMNTADRSLAMIDYALRRRFSFFEMEPGFDTDGFIDYQNGLDNETFDALIEQIVELNEEIAKDKSLGKGFCIGHSYFCNATEDSCTEEWMRDVVDFDILPMLEEYWFDDAKQVTSWKERLEEVFE